MIANALAMILIAFGVHAGRYSNAIPRSGVARGGLGEETALARSHSDRVV